MEEYNYPGVPITSQPIERWSSSREIWCFTPGVSIGYKVFKRTYWRPILVYKRSSCSKWSRSDWKMILKDDGSIKHRSYSNSRKNFWKEDTNEILGDTIFAKNIWTDRAKANISGYLRKPWKYRVPPPLLVNVFKYLQPPRDGKRHSRGNSCLLSTNWEGEGGDILVITGSSFSPSKHGYRFKVFGKDCSWCVTDWK